MNQRIFELRRVYLPMQGQELPFKPLYLAGLPYRQERSGGMEPGKLPG